MAKYRKNNGTGILVMSIITLFVALALAFGVVACTSDGFTDWSFLPWVNAEEQVPPTDDTDSPLPGDESYVPGELPDNSTEY